MIVLIHILIYVISSRVFEHTLAVRKLNRKKTVSFTRHIY